MIYECPHLRLSTYIVPRCRLVIIRIIISFIIVVIIVIAAWVSHWFLQTVVVAYQPRWHLLNNCTWWRWLCCCLTAYWHSTRLLLPAVLLVSNRHFSSSHCRQEFHQFHSWEFGNGKYLVAGSLKWIPNSAALWHPSFFRFLPGQMFCPQKRVSSAIWVVSELFRRKIRLDDVSSNNEVSVTFCTLFCAIGTTWKHSYGQWIEGLWASGGCWTAHETSAAELLGFLVLQEWQNERLAWEPESGYNLWHSWRLLGVSVILRVSVEEAPKFKSV